MAPALNAGGASLASRSMVAACRLSHSAVASRTISLTGRSRRFAVRRNASI